ncbi:hypothetical protein HS088_TW07G00809 [Tripterygium wilfordii]|uniref:Cyclin-D1-binding protein 1 n=1 Tax=Tripterygium wilfordii TaxID=458696 RepID=A0A7J7DGP5_TRIWF|nr:uncharacterized protein LOC120002315 [Tripterygium wilfordii]KAF5745226.1 hypothetical protein HS088_TW07G00809 [Tripterygium wilfordii]
MAKPENKQKQTREESHLRLKKIINSHFENLKETNEVLYNTRRSSSEKVNWEEIVKMGDHIYKHATIVGMLFNGQTPEAKELEESIEIYFNLIQGLLFLSHGSKVGAGYTLSSYIESSVSKVVDSSNRLLMDSVTLYGFPDRKVPIPQLVGVVWDACSALKKTPTTNITAIGRAVTQNSASIKDVLREMKELNPAPSGGASSSGPDDAYNVAGDDLGNDLSLEEMAVVQSAIFVVSDTLKVMKELIRAITGFLKLETDKGTGSKTFVVSLEKLADSCNGIRSQIDHIGACLYPPQDSLELKTAVKKIVSHVNELQQEVEHLESSSEVLSQACNTLKVSLSQMEYSLDNPNTIDMPNQP